MQRWTVISLFLLSIAVGSTGPAEATIGEPELLTSANQALEGRSARIELSTGEIVNRAILVNLGPVRTTWEAAGEYREVDTNDIERITLDKRARVKKWAKRGLVIGALVNGVGVGHSDIDGLFVEPDLEDALKGGAAGAAIGAGAAAMSKARVVYEAP